MRPIEDREASLEETPLSEPPADQAITPDGAPAPLPEDDPPPVETYRYADLEFDADTVPTPMGYEVTMRGLCVAAARARGLEGPAAWNGLDMPTRQDAVAEAYAWLCDKLEQSTKPILVEPMKQGMPHVSDVHQARALPLLPPGRLAESLPHVPGTVVRFKDHDGTTMVVVLFDGELFKSPANPQEN